MVNADPSPLTPEQRAVCVKAADDLQHRLGFVRASAVDIVRAVRAGKIRGLRMDFGEQKQLAKLIRSSLSGHPLLAAGQIAPAEVRRGCSVARSRLWGTICARPRVGSAPP